MTLWRSNHLLLSYLKQTKLVSPTVVSSILIRHATEIRSRKPVQPDPKAKQRKNTVNPVAQIKKLGPKAGNRFLCRWTNEDCFLSSTLAHILSNENMEAIYNRFDPLREEVSRDPAFLDELATVKNPLQNVVHLKDNDVRFR